MMVYHILFYIAIHGLNSFHVIGKSPSLNAGQMLGLKAAGPIGTFFGMLIFGYLGDRLGRKRMCMYRIPQFCYPKTKRSQKCLTDGQELAIIIIAVFVQSMLGQARAVNIINALIVWRFIVCYLLSSWTLSKQLN